MHVNGERICPPVQLIVQQQTFIELLELLPLLYHSDQQGGGKGKESTFPPSFREVNCSIVVYVVTETN